MIFRISWSMGWSKQWKYVKPSVWSLIFFPHNFLSNQTKLVEIWSLFPFFIGICSLSLFADIRFRVSEMASIAMDSSFNCSNRRNIWVFNSSYSFNPKEMNCVFGTLHDRKNDSVFFCSHLAPEYFMHGIVDEKTDVFAFGVFLLEIISGRKPVDGSHQSLHSWVMRQPLTLILVINCNPSSFGNPHLDFFKI